MVHACSSLAYSGTERDIMAKKPTPKQMKEFWTLVESGHVHSRNFQVFLRNPNGHAGCEFSVWKTVTLGTGLLTADPFRQAITQVRNRISDWADRTLGRPAFTVATQEIELDLVNVSALELGFTQSTTRREIYARAIERGLELCPAEVGPQLRLQYQDQPLHEWLLVGMEPIADAVGFLNVFYVGHYEDGLWLCRHSGHPDSVCSPDTRWVFVRPRK